MGAAIHTLHVLLAGVWLGGVVFTTLVVSPAFKGMKWSEAEREANEHGRDDQRGDGQHEDRHQVTEEGARGESQRSIEDQHG